MKRARAVIGANFGDEGKGLVTDWLCAKQGAGMVVRYNAGAQAGHTVVTPDGLRHVFQHFGSGTLAGVPTFLSQFFIVNPIMFFTEHQKIVDLGVAPIVYAHPNCLVTTFADMMINQRIEDARGKGRHGSVGLGFGETIERSTLPHLKITMADIWNGIPLESRLQEICDKYAAFRTGSAIDNPDPQDMIKAFIMGCNVLADAIHPLGIDQCEDPVFEGAQGLLLDQNNKQFFPHVTRSNTGMKNVRILCEQAGIDTIEPYYVSRTYLTRHGAGPLPGENPNMSFKDDTNLPHAYQGTLRFAPLNENNLYDRCAEDAEMDYRLVLTHCDQFENGIEATYRAFGPTRNDIRLSKNAKAA